MESSPLRTICWITASLCATIGLISLTPNRALAWGSVGHKVIARIAWDNLKPETRTKIIALLSGAPADSDLAAMRPANQTGADADRAFFEAAATWPDVMRGQRTEHEKVRRAKYHHGSWHYKDLFFEQNETTGKIIDRPDRPADAENSIERLYYMTPRIGDPSIDKGERGIELAWVEHLVGDVATPLHNVGRITALEPEGDQGGNLFKLEDKASAGREYPASLHAYWDDLPDTSFPAQPGEDPEARLGRIADAVTMALPKALFDEEGLNQPGRFDQWNYEGAEVAKTKVYSPLLKRGQMPSAEYVTEARQTVLVALAKAGYRLAATLEAALAPRN